MQFGPDDGDAFRSCQEELVAGFSETRTGFDTDTSGVHLLLDWKWGYDDGDLGTWTTGHFDEFLLDWCPRKVMMDASEASSMILALRAFIVYLASSQLLGRRSSSVAALDAKLRQNLGPFRNALGEREKFGIGKSIFAGIEELGLDLDDLDNPASIAAAIEAFNALSFDERGHVLGLGGGPFVDRGEPWDELTDGIALGPVPQIDVSELRALAAGAPVMRQFGILRDFLGAGRKLTAKGNLAPADAKALVDALDAGHVAGDGRFHAHEAVIVHSADDLPELQFLLRWAKAAGVVRVTKGRMLATASWSKLSLEEAAAKAFEALTAKGPLRLRVIERQRNRDGLAEFIDEGIAHLLAIVWSVGDGLSFDELLLGVTEVCDHNLSWHPKLDRFARESWIAGNFDLIWQEFVRAGLVQRRGADVVQTPWGGEQQVGGTLSFTSLGHMLVAPFLAMTGFEVPVIGEFTNGPIRAIFEVVGDWHPERVRGEFRAWAATRSVQQIADEIIDTLIGSVEPIWRFAAADFATSLPSPSDEHVMRRILDTPARGHAISWLLARGDDDVPDDPDALFLVAVESLSLSAGVDDDDEQLLELVRQLDQLGEIGDFIDRVWRIREPHAGDVLAGIARVHPDPKVAKRARKAVLQHRTHLANLR